MKILILEDNPEKLAEIISEIQIFDNEVEITTVTNQFDFSPLVERHRYDLIIIDLMVPSFQSEPPTDLTEMLILRIRDDECINIETPVLALTKYPQAAHKCVDDLSVVGLQIGHYSDNGQWKSLLLKNLKSSKPQEIYDFVIVCALQKEAKAFEQVLSNISPSENIMGLECRKVKVANFNGLIVTCPRMGLVVASIVTTKALEYFKPKVICMSGICAGLKSSGANIYDLIISDTSYQHDAGKWTNGKLVSEVYQVQLDPDVKTFINSKIIDNQEIESTLTQGVSFERDEYHDQYIKPKIKLEITSSGSTVIADSEIIKSVEDTHRKVHSFEMETFALYESARMSPLKPKYFSCKCVVDDGSESKGDNYHRLACLFAAKCTVEVLSGLLKSS